MQDWWLLGLIRRSKGLIYSLLQRIILILSFIFIIIFTAGEKRSYQLPWKHRVNGTREAHYAGLIVYPKMARSEHSNYCG